MHENHASIVALHRLKTFFKKSADTFASTQYYVLYRLQIIRESRHSCLYDRVSPISTTTFSNYFVRETKIYDNTLDEDYYSRLIIVTISNDFFLVT